MILAAAARAWLLARGSATTFTLYYVDTSMSWKVLRNVHRLINTYVQIDIFTLRAC
jgi:hypothetical protein